MMKQFEEKYLEQIKVISKEMNVDMGVAPHILIAHAKNRNKKLTDKKFYYRFSGYTSLNYEELDKDIKELEDAVAELRKQYNL